MKIKTVIEDRFPKRIPRKKMPKIFIIILTISQIIINQFLPFVWGVYFALTKHFIFLILFFLFLFFEVRVHTKGEEIKIKIIRGI